MAFAEQREALMSDSPAKNAGMQVYRKGKRMRSSDIFPVWGRILRGFQPFLSVEITKECPLQCPGCYAYAPGHLNERHSIRSVPEWRGNELIDRFFAGVRLFHPLHVSIVGGEPLLRYRELTPIIGRLDKMGIETQIVTSAVRRVPIEWEKFKNLHLVVSVDGLQTEHEIRRAPATYERILMNIKGHEVIVHCTVVRQFLDRPEYLREFVHLWSQIKNVRKIWISLYTPQKGEISAERIPLEYRNVAIDRIAELQLQYPKLYAPDFLLQGYRHPPHSPSECIFAQVTKCIAADLITPVTPCQIGGNPECTECGCVAAAGMSSFGKMKLAGLLKISNVFAFSQKVGQKVRSIS
jgi:organic radical activating enzyme